MSNGERERARGPLTDVVLGERYRLGAILGQGGMGVVYTGTQVSLDRPVAIKVLQPGLAQDLEAVARFRAEAERAGRLAHPHIVQILDFGREAEGSSWIAMELLSGESLAARIERGPLSEAEVVRIALEVLSALEAAHGASLVHRDLKPDNVFLASVPGLGASVKVLDFGIAKLLEADQNGRLTATGAMVGTPLYMSPEQARGGDIDARSDLYSLGALLYETLALRPPFTGTTYAALVLAVMTDAPRPLAELRPEITPALAAIVDRAMSKSAVDRFASAADMGAALRALTPPTTIPTMRGNKDAIAMAATLATPGPAAAPAQAVMPATRVSDPTPVAPPPASAPSVAVASAAAPTSTNRTAVAAIGGAAATLAIVWIATRFLSPPTPPPVEPREAPREPPPTVVAMQPIDLADPPSVVAPVEATEPEDDPPAPTPEADDPPTPEVSRTSTDPEITRAVARARRGFHPRVSPSGFSTRGMSSSADIRGPLDARGGWSECWPSEVDPVESTGRSFVLRLAGDGTVLDVHPRPGQAEPAAFSSCVVARVRTLSFPAPIAGEPLEVGFSLGIEPERR